VVKVLMAMDDKKIEKQLTQKKIEEENKNSKGNGDLATTADAEKNQVSEDEKVKRNWKRMLEYNQKSLMFILLICMGNLVLVSIVIHLYKVSYDENIGKIQDYFGCLLGATPSVFLSSEEKRMYGQGECGEVDEAVDIWDQFYYVILWQEFVGVLPLLVYGTRGKFKTAWKNIRSTFFASSTISPSTPHSNKKRSKGSSGTHTDSNNSWQMDKRRSMRRSQTSTTDLEMVPFVGFFIRSWRVMSSWLNLNGKKEEDTKEEENKEQEEDDENDMQEEKMESFDRPEGISGQLSSHSHSPSSFTSLTSSSLTRSSPHSQPIAKIELGVEEEGEEEEEEEGDTPAVNVTNKYAFSMEESDVQRIELELSRLDDASEQLI